jgi:hypothetical protein
MKLTTQFISKTPGIQEKIKRKILDFKVKEIPAFSWKETRAKAKLLQCPPKFCLGREAQVQK